MPRRGNVPKRDILPDPIYGSVLVTKLVNSIMLDGKKGVAQKVVYGAFQIVEEKTGKSGLEAFQQAMENIMPAVEVCKEFGPIVPILSTSQNNRDHRKICVIDGKVAFTGGVNLADEYINKKVRFGHWKDTAIKIEGDAVQSFTMMFLQMWNITERQPEDYAKYLTEKQPGFSRKDGYIIPYGDSPFDHENVGEEVYFHILNHAKKYVHIMTPYLILDNEMIDALTRAAKGGIEVQIIMPHIPDKPYAFYLAKTYYEELIAGGVEIYEYTPGFVHAKVFTSDDDTATVGSINLDYRSLYLHFECGVFIYRNPVVRDIEKDFQETLAKCQKVTMTEVRNRSTFVKIYGQVLRIVAPLM